MDNKEHHSEHSYVEFENTRLWRAVEEIVSDLEQNKDLQLMTIREYVIGYICQQLSSSKVVQVSAPQS